VKFDGGISKYSGLLNIALESGHVVKPSNGWYSKVNVDTGEVSAKKYRLADTDTPEFWDSILSDEAFKEWVRQAYQFTSTNSNVVDTEVEDVEE
jgi:endonuclease YncB( thermonuclease family)